MTTYVYETIPSTEDEKPELFEIQQGMHDAPLTKHPETGKPVRRVIMGGYDPLAKSGSSGEDCGTGCCCG